MLKAEVLSVGTELLMGQIANTDALRRESEAEANRRATVAERIAEAKGEIPCNDFRIPTGAAPSE